MKKTITILLLIIGLYNVMSFKPANKKPLKVQEYQLETVERNEQEQIIYVHYKKVGEPILMQDSNLNKKVFVILDN